MKRTCLFLVLFVFLIRISDAQNPICPPGVYIADPTARVWTDGKVYVYGSRDESPDRYCSWRYDVLSSDNLKTWQLIPNSFASKGKDDAVSYCDDLLYAPDCMCKKGKYYLYYCLASQTQTEGVAISDSPKGPFQSGTNINLGEHRQIDPAVFIDDDGQGYYVWGQFSAKMAKLKPNMTEVDLSTVKSDVITEKKHFFHEGVYMIKHQGIYYLIYAHMGRGGRPTCLGHTLRHQLTLKAIKSKG